MDYFNKIFKIHDISNEERRFRWNVASIGNGLSAMLSGLLVLISSHAHSSADLYLTVFDEYDKGVLLSTITVVGLVSLMICLFGTLLCYYSANRERFRLLRGILYSYILWLIYTTVLLFVSCFLIFSTSRGLANALKASGYIII